MLKNCKYQLCLLLLHSILDQVPRSSRSLNLWSTHFGDNCSRICQIKIKQNLFQDFVHREIVQLTTKSRKVGSNNLSLYAAKVRCIESLEYELGSNLEWLQTRWLARIWTVSEFVHMLICKDYIVVIKLYLPWILGSNLYWLQTGSLTKNMSFVCIRTFSWTSSPEQFVMVNNQRLPTATDNICVLSQNCKIPNLDLEKPHLEMTNKTKHLNWDISGSIFRYFIVV